MQALYLPETRRPLLVRVTYGDQSHCTFSVPHSADLSWYQESSFSDVEDVNEVSEGGGARVGAAVGLGPSTEGGLNVDGVAYGVGEGAAGTAAGDRKDAVRRGNDALKTTLNIDTLNIRGFVKLRVMMERFPKNKEIARLELPVFNLLDCTCVLPDDEVYERWFPLMLTSECIPAEGEMALFEQSAMKEQQDHTLFGHQPCIRLRVRWVEDRTDHLSKKAGGEAAADVDASSKVPFAATSTDKGGAADGEAAAAMGRRHQLPPVGQSVVYARLQLPSLSVSVIDSDRAREVVQMCVAGVELRHYVTVSRTEYLLNITAVQVDNQLPDPVAPVLLHATQKKHPQPVVRLHLMKNNLLSVESNQYTLACYEDFHLVVQELDVHLEQQTVIASWELIHNCWDILSTMFGESGAVSQSDNSDAFSLVDGAGDLRSSSTSHQYMQPPVPSDSSDMIMSKMPEFAAGSDVTRLYIDRFGLHSIKINVSFVMTPEVISGSNLRAHERTMFFMGRHGLLSELTSFLRQLGEIVMGLTTSISNAPIFISGMTTDHLFMSDRELANTLQQIYFQSIVSQVTLYHRCCDGVFLLPLFS